MSSGRTWSIVRQLGLHITKGQRPILEKIQHRFTRMFPELRNLQYSERLNKLSLWTLEERRNRADLIKVFKIINGFSVVPVDILFALSDDTRTRGHSSLEEATQEALQQRSQTSLLF